LVFDPVNSRRPKEPSQDYPGLPDQSFLLLSSKHGLCRSGNDTDFMSCFLSADNGQIEPIVCREVSSHWLLHQISSGLAIPLTTVKAGSTSMETVVISLHPSIQGTCRYRNIKEYTRV
jgi:hypothetical protein